MNSPEFRAEKELVASSHLPEAVVTRWARSFVRFLRIEAASGIVLMVCTLVALCLANSPWGGAFAKLWETHFHFGLGSWQLDESLRHWINDGLMTIFFFVVGLEIKRELVTGELRDPKQAALPVVAAIGGMVAPAIIYVALRSGRPGHEGWAIPMATDIAFVVGFLALLGSRVPVGLKVFLLSLAIVDDIGAVLVIAIFFSSDISVSALGLATLGFGLIVALNLVGVRRISVYVVVGTGIWLAFQKSGIHPTVAGVLLGLLTPARAWVADGAILELAREVVHRLRRERDGEVEHYHKPLLSELRIAARETVSPLERLEGALHPWVAFGIMPLFALANAGVVVEFRALGEPIAMAVATGLVVGKPLGIMLFSWLGILTGLARLPAGVNWKAMFGGACLSGIGFTMSIFISNLALSGRLLDAGKVGVMAGSTVSAIAGFMLLFAALRKPTAHTGEKVLKTNT